MFIPKKIKVGFQNRSDTYTQKLAYVIYYDEKGKLRKETSWDNWRDKKIDPVEFENVPTEGFVLNKKVGGYTNGWSNFRQAYVRVYDPRGFEFEITVPNLLYILENTSSIKGKGLEGEFVYGWDGTDLVLIPAVSPDYEQLTSLNQKRFENKRIAAKDLKIGATYLTKDNNKVVYLGKFDFYDTVYLFDGQVFPSYKKLRNYAGQTGKEITGRKRNSNWPYFDYNFPLYETKKDTVRKHYFFSSSEEGGLINKESVSGWLIDVLTETCADDYADRMEKLEHSTMYSPYDESKDTFVDYSLEELRNAGSRWGSTMAVLKGNEVWYIELMRDETTGEHRLLKPRSKEKALDPQAFFEMEKVGYQLATIPLSPEEIAQTLHFVHIDQYLANGKFYRRTY